MRVEYEDSWYTELGVVGRFDSKRCGQVLIYPIGSREEMAIPSVCAIFPQSWIPELRLGCRDAKSNQLNGVFQGRWRSTFGS